MIATTPLAALDWHTVWRRGLAPLLSRAALAALSEALLLDDPRLRQHVSVWPPPGAAFGRDRRLVLSACPLAWAGWQGEGLEHVDEVDEYLGRLCHAADALLGCPGAVSAVLMRWWDQGVRDQVRRLFLAEVRLALVRAAS